MDNGDCKSRYTVWNGFTLRCEKHLQGNPFRNETLHASTWLGTLFYWNDREADKEEA